ncbi:hypothetical protein I1A62_25195 [Rhodococcus sp. USK10]|uniref:Uncharacterized protein n=1 Tax=Rhodococcus wratislaviensis TaxID=44752 RepID=A0A402C689_RHOWR|nr:MULTISPECIES: hypothetical protein [Rhodococcus]QYB07527.1 hypothetical protein I1A62_25195 [Rhodococcus sp. USK10]GCE39102.1 hypothetical protein Rhow_002626 [Rhodococcus wratislaviensis]
MNAPLGTLADGPAADTIERGESNAQIRPLSECTGVAQRSVVTQRPVVA